jgi:regulatory protein
MQNLKRKITAIRAGRNSRVQRSNIFLDGKFAFSLDNGVVLKESLRIGQELSSPEIKQLTQANTEQRCLNAALQFLSFRPRSEAETRLRLRRRGYPDAAIDPVVSQLKRSRLLDDAAFAGFWKENRSSFRPRGQRLLKLELRRKGVKSEIIDEVTEDLDETENALRAAVNRARTLPVSDYQIFRQRLGNYLQRRGFSYRVANTAVQKAWQERTGSSGPEPALTQEVNSTD